MERGERLRAAVAARESGGENRDRKRRDESEIKRERERSCVKNGAIMRGSIAGREGQPSLSGRLPLDPLALIRTMP